MKNAILTHLFFNIHEWELNDTGFIMTWLAASLFSLIKYSVFRKTGESTAVPTTYARRNIIGQLRYMFCACIWVSTPLQYKARLRPRLIINQTIIEQDWKGQNTTGQKGQDKWNRIE